MSEKKLSETFLAVLDNTATKDDVKELLHALKDLIADLRAETSQNTASHKDEMTATVKQAIDAFNAIKGQIQETKDISASDRRTTMRYIDQKTSDLEALITYYDDAPLRDEFIRRISDLEAKIPTLPPSLSPDDIETKIISAKEDVTADVEKKVTELKTEISNVRSMRLGAGRGLQLYVDGGKKGLAQYVNLIAGTNVTLSYSHANGRNDVTISSTGGSGSLSLVTATGAVDDSNTSFTFSAEPSLVIINGASYRHGKGVTISGTSVTTDNPVGAGGDIYGLASS